MAGEVHCVFYDDDNPPRVSVHPYLANLEEQTRRGLAVRGICAQLKRNGFIPDAIVCHPGWGEGLFLKDVYPESPLLSYCEYYYAAKNSDLDFDPEFPPHPEAAPLIRLQNACLLVSLTGSDAGFTPTHWQKSLFPQEFMKKIKVIHEGVDTNRITPDPSASFRIPGTDLTLDADCEVVTFATRSLEPYRGFHTFMRALPFLLEARPRCHVLIVGKDEVAYGRRLPGGQSYREKYCSEIAFDPARVHFAPFLPFERYLSVLRISTVHAYLTYPFVLSWSLLEAMAAGCLVVGSDTAPVREIIRNGHNGLLVDFFNPYGLAHTIASCLEQRQWLQGIRDEARKTIVTKYDLERKAIPAQLHLLSKTMDDFSRGAR